VKKNLRGWRKTSKCFPIVYQNKKMITLPQNFVSDLTDTMGGTMGDLLPLVLFIGGVTFGIYILISIITGGIAGADKK